MALGNQHITDNNYLDLCEEKENLLNDYFTHRIKKTVILVGGFCYAQIK